MQLGLPKPNGHVTAAKFRRIASYDKAFFEERVGEGVSQSTNGVSAFKWGVFHLRKVGLVVWSVVIGQEAVGV
ncbi:hypothetical protein NPIL_49671 [Nephila pilipes]|uniref:Uncharacterized protein n=1 Tax=Nephila pilipes TaxID=299642 RepID=A0A8X6N979_NEPPI|nr:hypothetical protein NPIL_49671 [Nephila pilipes]